MSAKIDEKSILEYFESFHEKHARRYKCICDDYTSLIKQNIQSRTPSKEIVDQNVSKTINAALEFHAKKNKELEKTYTTAVEQRDEALNTVSQLKKDLDQMKKNEEEMKRKCEFLEAEVERQRVSRNELESRLVKIQADNDMLIVKIKSENERRMLDFNEFFEKEALVIKEREEIKKEREMLADKQRLLRGYISQLSRGENPNSIIDSASIGNLINTETANRSSQGADLHGFDIVEFKYEKGNSLNCHSKSITAMKLSPSGDVIATASEDGYIKVTNLVNRKEISSIYNQDRIGLDLDMHSHNNDYLLVGNNNNTAHLWSIKGGKVKYSFTSHSDSVNTVGFFDTKKCFTGSSDSTLKLWDLNKGNLAVTFLCGTKCFSSATDGHLIYTGHNNGYIKFWSENKKTPVVEKKIHSGSISHLLLSSDNNSLISISKGTEINIFDIRTHNVVKTIPLEGFSLPNGKVQFDIDRELSRIFIGDSSGNGRVFDLCTTIPKLRDTYSVCSAPITGAAYSNILEQIMFSDTEGKVHIYRQTM